MKRYITIGESFDFEEYKNGEVVFYDDFINFISAQIEKLEMELSDSKDKVGLTKAIIELRKLIE